MKWWAWAPAGVQISTFEAFPSGTESCSDPSAAPTACPACAVTVKQQFPSGQISLLPFLPSCSDSRSPYEDALQCNDV